MENTGDKYDHAAHTLPCSSTPLLPYSSPRVKKPEHTYKKTKKTPSHTLNSANNSYTLQTYISAPDES